jgi:membrane-bound metal-dependent hydrolase YbcI (DUF457 family)
MVVRVPSPIGHALAGLTVSWAFAPRTTATAADWSSAGWLGRVSTLTVACVAAAVLPDLDLVYYPYHRTATHSVGFTMLTFILTAGVTRWVTGRAQWKVALMVSAAQSTHILLDWLGVDRRLPFGLEALWPFSHRWYISGWDVFLPTERRDPFSMRAIEVNIRAVLRELAIMGTIAIAARGLRRKRRSPGLSSGPNALRPPSAAAAGRAGTSDLPGRRA